MSILRILNTGASGLRAHGLGVQVASDNIANVNTPGYARRKVELQANQLQPNGPGGVRAKDANRVVDQFLEARLTAARAETGGAEAQVESLQILDFAFSDEAGNLGEALGAFQQSLGDVAANPNSQATREVALGRATQLATSFQQTASLLSEQRAQLNGRITSEVGEVNTQLETIAQLNQAIAEAENTGQEASHLRAQRDQALTVVSGKVPVKVIDGPQGSIQVMLNGGSALVSFEGGAQPLIASEDPATGDVTVSQIQAGRAVDVTSQIPNGRIGGLLSARDGALSQAQAGLDQLAVDTANAFNAVHSAGFGLDGVSGRNLFTATEASDFQLSADVAGQPEALAAAQDAGLLPGDNRNAQALQDVFVGNVANGGTATLDQAFQQLVTEGATAVQMAMAERDQAQAVETQATNMREAVSGVSIDEETVSLISFQRAFEASARLVSVADEMYESILAMKR